MHLSISRSDVMNAVCDYGELWLTQSFEKQRTAQFWSTKTKYYLMLLASEKITTFIFFFNIFIICLCGCTFLILFLFFRYQAEPKLPCINLYPAVMVVVSCHKEKQGKTNKKMNEFRSGTLWATAEKKEQDFDAKFVA